MLQKSFTISHSKMKDAMGTASLPSIKIQESIPAHHQCILTLEGHSSYISALAVHGDSLYSGSSDQNIRIWTSIDPSGQLELESLFITCNSPIKSLLISGNTMFSSHQDHKIRVWHIDHKLCRLKTILPTAMDRILGLLSPNKYVQVRRHKKCMWVQHVDAVSALAISSDRSLLYSVSWDRTLKIWRCSDFKCMESVARAHHDAINAVVVSKNGFIYTGSADKTIKVWKKHQDQNKHSLLDTLEKHRSAINTLALSSDEFILYAGACNGSVVICEVGKDGHIEAMGALRGHTRAVLCLSTRGNLVCSGSADRTVRMWMRGEAFYSCLAVFEGHKGPVKSLVMVRSKSSTCLVYSGSLDCDIKVWKLLVPSSEGDA